MNDIVKRLRRLGFILVADDMPSFGSAMREAAAELTRLRADLAAVERERDAFRRALNEIAAFGDTVASAHLKRYGSYAAFDEPGSVRIARAALEKPND